MESAPIGQSWDKLDPDIREWLINNPGTVILPRSVVNALNEVRGNSNGPGQLEVSAEDRDFLKEMAEARRRERTGGGA
ncbi:hypothetical protein LVY72_10425 [Arthrobacter sp. I2-34]|uniref:Uncharacterized protein n=1 Tax=Arthrobacter hankyongi TaxID=2904801 RepID=A0ABS9L6N7_9MICC|nr:hypothetical protein [Arthrobacter hankyongi]MCG2622332.1 hypothetical protein [Arthrobacter hankyongi]